MKNRRKGKVAIFHPIREKGKTAFNVKAGCGKIGSVAIFHSIRENSIFYAALCIGFTSVAKIGIFAQFEKRANKAISPASQAQKPIPPAILRPASVHLRLAWLRKLV